MHKIIITISDNGVVKNVECENLETGTLTLGEALEVIIDASNQKQSRYLRVIKQDDKK